MHRKLLPEVVQLITRTLTKYPKKGVRIASEWHCEIPTDPRLQNSPVDALHRPKDLVVNLTEQETAALNPAKLSIIQSLTVTDPRDAPYQTLPQATARGHKFAILEHLGLDGVQPPKINWFLYQVQLFPSLQSLVLTNTYLDRDGALYLWRFFPQLEVLALMDVNFMDMSAVREQMKGMLCPRLAKLYLHYNNPGFPMEDQYQLLLACPSLAAFHWLLPKGHEEHVFPRDFTELRQDTHPERVREIDELHIVGDVDDYGIALAINNMPSIKSLSIYVDNQIGTISFQAIRNISATLCRFEAHSHFMTSATVELVLSSCPLLHTMIARTMSAHDATKEKRREWICAQSLKVLSLNFVFESHEAHLQDEVCQKLAQLTRLEQLIMNEPCDNIRPGTFGLRLRVATGFWRLRTLTNLTLISTLDDFTDESLIEERTWMADNWPQLLRFHCADDSSSMEDD
ncbi:hypothetical protein BGZ72_008217 [Mortierella alpina]|nr:hypothetical protein BGZ72_008217 [Mortierella alpina]